jgi:hypothetical protein
MVLPNDKNVNNNKEHIRQNSPNNRVEDPLRSSIHSLSDNSLQLSDDEVDVVAATRLNTWLNGASNENPIQLGNGSITGTTPVNPFAACNDLPSPFSVNLSSPGLHGDKSAAAQVTDAPDHSFTHLDYNAKGNKPPSPPMSIGTNMMSLNNFQNLGSSPQNISDSLLPALIVTKGAGVGKIPNTPSNNFDLGRTDQKETIHGQSVGPRKNIGGNSNVANVPTQIAIEPPVKPHHQRTVSWGNNPEVSSMPPKGPKSSPKVSPLPSRHNRIPSEFSLFSVLTDSDSELEPRSQKDAGSRIDMEEVLRMNPLETEAETLILKVIEAQETIKRNRANTGQSSIFENIPDDAAHIFMPQINENISSKSSAADTAKSNQHSSNMDGQTEIDAPNRVNGNAADLGPSTLPLASTSVGSSSRKVASSPILSAAAPIQSNRRPPPRPTLNRATTVEYKLANISEALAGYHNKASEDTNASNINVHHRADVEEKPFTLDESAGEKLAKNASLIYRGRQKTGGKTDKPSVPKPKINGATNHDTAMAMPTSTDIRIPLASGSVEERKKTDVFLDDIQLPQPDAMECGTSTGEHEGSKYIGKMRNQWLKIPIINSTAARDFRMFVWQRQSALYDYLRFMVIVVIPALATSAILFYFAGRCRFASLFR